VHDHVVNVTANAAGQLLLLTAWSGVASARPAVAVLELYSVTNMAPRFSGCLTVQPTEVCASHLKDDDSHLCCSASAAATAGPALLEPG
jgi:hypothetical protein